MTTTRTFLFAHWLLSLLLMLNNALVVVSEEGSCSSAEDPTCQEREPPPPLPQDNNEAMLDVDKAQRFHDFIAHMFHSLEAHAATLEKPNLRAQEENILNSWFQYFAMDQTLIKQVPLKTNWLYDIYKTTKSIAPPQFWKTWDERAKPNREEIQILLNIDESALDEAVLPDGSLNEDALMSYLFMPFRQRGFTASLLDTFCRVVLGPLKTIAYAIPSPENLDLIAQYGPLIEVGAGTGYWSANLQNLGVEITPFDMDPPEETKQGMYFDRTYTTVHSGTCESIFANQPANNRTLLMVWPNNPDNIDNAKEFHDERLPPVWDVDCLKAFVAAGGTTVILVAEREDNIHILPDHPQNPTQPDSGLCASRALQTMLKNDFELLHEMPIPTWYYSDDLTVWKVKQ